MNENTMLAVIDRVPVYLAAPDLPVSFDGDTTPEAAAQHIRLLIEMVVRLENFPWARERFVDLLYVERRRLLWAGKVAANRQYASVMRLPSAARLALEGV